MDKEFKYIYDNNLPISIYVLMRKFKITRDYAKEIFEKYKKYEIKKNKKWNPFLNKARRHINAS